VFTLRETVPTDTPDNRATSRIVAGFPLVFFKRALLAQNPNNRRFRQSSLINTFLDAGEVVTAIQFQGF
jgi:hypothetical protein